MKRVLLLPGSVICIVSVPKCVNITMRCALPTHCTAILFNMSLRGYVAMSMCDDCDLQNEIMQNTLNVNTTYLYFWQFQSNVLMRFAGAFVT